MYCKNCGTLISGNARFCTSCGAETTLMPADCNSATNFGRIGYSSKINDPAFARYIRSSNRWSAIFAAILAAAAVIGFFIYGETSYEMDNPETLYIGLCIGGMFLTIALLQVIGRKRDRTWDGTVVDKTVKKKSRRQCCGSDKSDYYIQCYTEYAVVIRDTKGKNHCLTAEDDTVYNYYIVGDLVRHHEGLNTFEKYDKSKDSIIFCNACSTLCSIEDDLCFRCKCPLLK